MTLRDFFVIKHKGRIVASLCLIPLKWSIGGVPLKVAEMGCVATLSEYRHHGLQRRLVAEYHKRVAEEGYELSAIEGIPYFYRQFGYEYALPLLEETRISLNQIPDYKPKHKIRPLAASDISRAMQLLDRTQQKFYVRAIREEGIWRMQEKTGMVAEYNFESHVVEEKGETIAYFRTSENPETKELFLREITDLDETAAHTVLGFLKEIGKKQALETLVVQTSYLDLFTGYVTALGGVKQVPPYAWQIRITDYLRIFQKLKPLFEKRLASSAYCRTTETVNFNFYRFTVQMTVKDGVVTDVQRLESSEDRTIRFNPIVFTQLLLGHRSREELEAVYPDCIVRLSHRQLVDVLFPKLPSYIHTAY